MFFHWKRPVVPGAEALTQYRGTLTAQSAGAVNVGQLSAGPFVATGSSFTLISGTAGHWTTPTDGTTPTPTLTGTGAGLNGGPYVFTYTSTDGVNSRSGTFTINTRANTRTVSKRSEVYTARTTGPLANLASDITIELARGATDFANATAASPFYIYKWRAATGIVLTNEDDTHKTPIGNLYAQLPKNVTIRNLDIRPAARSVYNATEKAVYVHTTSPSAATDQLTTNIFTNDGSTITGVGDPTLGVYGWYISASGAPLTYAETGTVCASWVQKGYNLDDSNDKGLFFDTQGTSWVERWTMDAVAPTWGASQLSTAHFADLRLFAPMIDSTRSGIHPDGIQIPSGTSIKNFTIDRLTLIQGAGDSISQTFFSSDNAGRIGVTIKNAISVGRSHHVATLGGTDSTHQAKIGNYTAITQWSGVYSSDDPTTNVLNPGVILDSGVSATDTILKNIFMQGSLSNSSTYTPDASVVHLNDTTGDISAYLPNASWLTSPTLRTTALANGGGAYSGLADSRLSDTKEAVYANIIAALTPASGQLGALMSDGTRPLATFP